MRKLLLLFVVIIGMTSYSQIVFEPGYLIDNQGVRRDCVIRNSEWFRTPAFIIYKDDISSKIEKTGTTAEIAEFGINGTTVFRRFTVNIEKSSTLLAKLPNSGQPVWTRETLFLKLLVGGTANLYSYSDGDVSKYFYETPTIPIEQLISINYYSNSLHVKKNQQFRQQLFLNVNCGGLTADKIKKINYSRSDLSSHFVSFNKCHDNDTPTFESTTSRGKYSVKAVVAIESATITIVDELKAYNVSSDRSAMIIKPGLEFEYYLPFNKSSWSIFMGANYFSFKKKDNFSNPSGLSSTAVDHQAVTDFSGIEFPVGLRYYHYLHNGSAIYIHGGLALETNFTSSIRITNKQELVNATENINLTSRQSLFFAIGYSYKKYTADLRYAKAEGILEAYSPEMNGSYNAFSLNMGYRFL